LAGESPEASTVRDQPCLAGHPLTATTLLSWLALLALNGPLARAEAKTLCYR
jgi:hypothetical protein